MNREKVIRIIDELIFEAQKEPTWKAENALRCLKKELLKEQEAKTGKWERQHSRPGVYANLFWWCSVCGEPTRYDDAGIFYQYCPHCGAKLEAFKYT